MSVSYSYKETKDKIKEFEKDYVTVLKEWSSDLCYCGICGAEKPSKRIIELNLGTDFFPIVLRHKEYHCHWCGCSEYIESISDEEWEKLNNKNVSVESLIKSVNKLVKSKENKNDK